MDDSEDYDDRLAAWLTTEPIVVQIAADGIWEDPWTVRAGERVTVQSIDEWFAGRGADVAVELFFADQGGTRLFVGVRVAMLTPAERRDFVADTLSRLAERRWRSLAEVLVGWRLPSGNLAVPTRGHIPTAIEIGVVNAWKSVGACTVWRPGQPDLDLDHLATILAGQPQLREPHATPTAVELAFSQPLPHWIGIYAAERGQDGRYRLVPEIVLNIANQFITRGTGLIL
jgi:hypothetical protein